MIANQKNRKELGEVSKKKMKKLTQVLRRKQFHQEKMSTSEKLNRKIK